MACIGRRCGRTDASESLVTATPQARTAGTRLPRPARRRQLLGAAQEVFVAQGYHAAAMDESAEALTATIRHALASTTDNKQRVRATFQAFFDFVTDSGQAFRLVFESD